MWTMKEFENYDNALMEEENIFHDVQEPLRWN
jgi:hypothetical protein